MPLTASDTRTGLPPAGPPARGVPRRRGARLLAWVTAGWLLFTVLQVLLTGRWWLWLLPGLLPPVVFLGVPSALLVSFVAVHRKSLRRAVRTWPAVVLAGCLVLGAGQSGVRPQALFGSDPAPPPAGALRVLSWNTKYWDQADDPDRFYRYLKQQDADVYLLQEYIEWVDEEPRPLDDLPRLRKEFPGFHIAVQGELLTLSRYPVVSRTSVQRGTEPGPYTPWADVYRHAKVLRTDLRIRDTTVSFYNVHVVAPVDRGLSPFGMEFYRVIQEADARRKDQYGALARDVSGNPNAAVVAGDFNTSPAMGDLRALSGRLKDATLPSTGVNPLSWDAEGTGLWRLDWAFTTDELRVHRYRLLDPAGMSDHRSQQLTVSLR